MRELSTHCKISALIFLTLPLFLANTVMAAGFQLDETSPGLQGAAMAGAAAAENDVSALFNNPATLSTLIQNQIYVGGSEIMPHVRMSHGSAQHTVNVPGFPPTNISAVVQGLNSQNNIGKPAFVPDAYAGYRLNDKFVIGVSITAPFGLTTKYYGDSVLRFAAVTSAVKVVDINPALSYQLNEQWSLGVGLQAQFMRATFSNFNGPYTGIPDIDVLIAPTSPTYLKANGWGYGYTLGALYKYNAATRIGVGYRSMVSMRLNGNGMQYTTPGGIVPPASVDFPFNGLCSVNGAIKTPAVLTLSAARDVQRFTFKATAQLNFWDTFDHLSINMPEAYATNSTIQTKWSNAWFGSIGADYRYRPALTLRGGLAYDQTPTSGTYRDPRIPDADRIWLNVGASYLISKQISLDGAYSHIFMRSQSVNVTQASGSNASSTLPLEVNQVSARYHGSVDIVSLALRYSF